MRLATPEFIRRFLIHVLLDGFHRIRHYGLLASATRKANITKVRALLCVQYPDKAASPNPPFVHRAAFSKGEDRQSGQTGLMHLQRTLLTAIIHEDPVLVPDGLLAAFLVS
jgi:hypothetical protein